MENIEQAKKDFEELFQLAEKFMKKYGSETSVLVITNEEIKIVESVMFRKFKEEE